MFALSEKRLCSCTFYHAPVPFHQLEFYKRKMVAVYVSVDKPDPCMPFDLVKAWTTRIRTSLFKEHDAGKCVDLLDDPCISIHLCPLSLAPLLQPPGTP